ncbi:ABC transporter ATP-binding protein [Actinotignum sanguinis]|uniref:ATP-binding cassette domain-containing protein n=1 Tax=Actinotignum sanguinis TaxID=1445614 RepID=UPI00237EC29B|nr:ABC transporter ATP-binding protein [Actinotignum sanguinis]
MIVAQRPSSRGADPISAPGRRAALIAAFLRLATIAAIIAGYVTAAHASVGAVGVAGGTVVPPGTGTLWLAAGFFAVAGACAIAERVGSTGAARAEERRLRALLLDRTFTLARTGTPTPYTAGRLLPLLTDSVERITNYRQGYVGTTIGALLAPFLTLTFIGVAIDPVIGFGVMAALPLIPAGIGIFFRFFRRASSESRRARDTLVDSYLDAIRNMTTIRLFNAGERIEADLARRGEANRRAIMRMLAGNQIVIIVMDGLVGLLLICLTAGLTTARAAHLAPWQALAVALLAVVLLEPLSQVAGFFYIGMGGRAAQKAITRYLAIAPRMLHDGAAAAPSTVANDGAPRNDGATSPASAAPLITVKNAAVNYGREEVLTEVNLRVERGERLAIVGASGAGKSTLLALLRGALRPQSGSVQIGEVHVDAESGDLTQLRARSAVVAQTTWMFTGTIANNLRLARPDATAEQMWDALERAQVAKDVARMPEGLDTYLGEDSALISGGQAQRISLARAFLAGRTLLLLDEPTAQVDVESEDRICAALAGLGPEYTLVMVTHRPALAALADRVVRLRDGILEEVSDVHAE